MSKKLILPFLMLFVCLFSTAQQPDSTSIHRLSIPGANGDTIRFSNYAGKKIFIVNTASLANNKQQIGKLQTLQQNNASTLVVIAVPCDDFNNLEPEDNNVTILQLYQQQFSVTFPVSAKLHANGTAIHPLFVFLTDKELNGRMQGRVKENFRKFLLDENGHLIASFAGSIDPLSEIVQQAIQQ